MLFRKLFIGLLTTSIGFAAPALSIENLSLPKLKKGIWAVTVDQEIIGQRPKHFPASRGSQCEDPTVATIENLKSLKKNGCSIEVASHTESELIILTACKIPTDSTRTVKIANMRVRIHSSNPTDFEVTTETEHGRVNITGHWVSACKPGEGNESRN